MKAYVGTKIVKAAPMSRDTFSRMQGRGESPSEDEPGYLVVYPDGYQSWSPKKVFEEAYREVSVMEAKIAELNVPAEAKQYEPPMGRDK